MAWSTPLTAVSNTALTAAQWNASVRDNLLETAPAKATGQGQLIVGNGANAIAARTAQGDFVTSAQTTTSTSYTDLATTGPSVTVTSGTFAVVALKTDAVNSGAFASVMSYAVSGATTRAADDFHAIGSDDTTKSRCGAVMLETVTAGSNTFTAKYRVTGGTGTFVNRSMVVIPL